MRAGFFKKRKTEVPTMAEEFEYESETEEGDSSTGAGKSGKVEFTMPRGDAEFDALEPGEKMTVRCTIRKEEGGAACLVAVNGTEVSSYTEEEDEDEQEEEGGFEEMLEREI